MVASMRSFVFEKEFIGSYNLNFLAHEKDAPNSHWVVKVSKNTRAELGDLNERALLAYRLAHLAGVRVVETELAHLNQCEGLDVLSPEGVKTLSLRMNDTVTLTRPCGISLGAFLRSHTFEEIKNFDEILRGFVFNLWIGNYDRKLEDYVVNEAGEISHVDYQLSGPGFLDDPEVAIGAYAQKYYLSNPEDTAWCLEGRLDNKVGALLQKVRNLRPKIEVFLPYIEQMQQLSKTDIETAFNGLTLYSQRNKKVLNKDFVAFLISRQPALEPAVREWIDARYPIGKRPK